VLEYAAGKRLGPDTENYWGLDTSEVGRTCLLLLTESNADDVGGGNGKNENLLLRRDEDEGPSLVVLTGGVEIGMGNGVEGHEGNWNSSRLPSHTHSLFSHTYARGLSHLRALFTLTPPSYPCSVTSTTRPISIASIKYCGARGREG